jgi:hypothetical protein
VNVERPIGERLGKWEELERETGREEASGNPRMSKETGYQKGNKMDEAEGGCGLTAGESNRTEQ